MIYAFGYFVIGIITLIWYRYFYAKEKMPLLVWLMTVLMWPLCILITLGEELNDREF